MPISSCSRSATLRCRSATFTDNFSKVTFVAASFDKAVSKFDCSSANFFVISDRRRLARLRSLYCPFKIIISLSDPFILVLSKRTKVKELKPSFSCASFFRASGSWGEAFVGMPCFVQLFFDFPQLQS